MLGAFSLISASAGVPGRSSLIHPELARSDTDEDRAIAHFLLWGGGVTRASSRKRQVLKHYSLVRMRRVQGLTSSEAHE